MFHTYSSCYRGESFTMESQIEVRVLSKNDNMTELFSLSKDFFEEYESNHDYFFQIDTLKEEDIKGYFSSFIGSEDKTAFIAVKDGRIVGYITAYIMNQPEFWKIKQVGHISGIMVQKSMRRKGIAKKLMLPAIYFFKERHVNYYTLFTSDNNVGAIKFYERFGMTPLYLHLLGSADL